NGTLLWNGGDICLAQGSHIVNAKQFTINANGRKMYICASGNVSDVFNQAGATLIRNGTAGQLTRIDEPINNAGTIDVAAGNLAIGPNTQGASDIGTVKLGNISSPNATLDVASGAQRTFAAGAS